MAIGSLVSSLVGNRGAEPDQQPPPEGQGDGAGVAIGGVCLIGALIVVLLYSATFFSS